MVTEPFFEPESLDYEIFADLTVMQMTVNHIISLLAKQDCPTLGRWLVRENLISPKLIISEVRDGTYASRNMEAGMVLRSINGNKVSTLADFRKYFLPGTQADAIWKLETERDIIYDVEFRKSLQEQLLRAQGEVYLRTPAVMESARALGMLQSPGTATGKSAAVGAQSDGMIDLNVTQLDMLLSMVFAQGRAKGRAESKNESSPVNTSAPPPASAPPPSNSSNSSNTSSLGKDAAARQAHNDNKLRYAVFNVDSKTRVDRAASLLGALTGVAPRQGRVGLAPNSRDTI